MLTITKGNVYRKRDERRYLHCQFNYPKISTQPFDLTLRSDPARPCSIEGTERVLQPHVGHTDYQRARIPYLINCAYRITVVMISRLMLNLRRDDTAEHGGSQPPSTFRNIASFSFSENSRHHSWGRVSMVTRSQQRSYSEWDPRWNIGRNSQV